METILSVEHKVELEDCIVTDGLNKEMLDTTRLFHTLHSVSESTKYQYLRKQEWALPYKEIKK